MYSTLLMSIKGHTRDIHFKNLVTLKLKQVYTQCQPCLIPEYSLNPTNNHEYVVLFFSTFLLHHRLYKLLTAYLQYMSPDVNSENQTAETDPQMSSLRWVYPLYLLPEDTATSTNCLHNSIVKKHGICHQCQCKSNNTYPQLIKRSLSKKVCIVVILTVCTNTYCIHSLL